MNGMAILPASTAWDWSELISTKSVSSNCCRTAPEPVAASRCFSSAQLRAHSKRAIARNCEGSEKMPVISDVEKRKLVEPSVMCRSSLPCKKRSFVRALQNNIPVEDMAFSRIGVRDQGVSTGRRNLEKHAVRVVL